MMDRENAVRLLVHAAKEYRAAMIDIEHDFVFRPETLLLLAYESAILDRYARQYDELTPELKLKVDEAKMRCRLQHPDLHWEDRIVSPHFAPAIVNTVKCNCCRGEKHTVDILANAGDAAPLWTRYYHHS